MFYPIQTKPPIVATTATMTSSPTTWVVATQAPSARWPRAPMSPEEGPSLRSISHPRKHRARTIFSVRHLFSLIYTYAHEMGAGVSMWYLSTAEDNLVQLAEIHENIQRMRMENASSSRLLGLSKTSSGKAAAERLSVMSGGVCNSSSTRLSNSCPSLNNDESLENSINNNLQGACVISYLVYIFSL